MIDKAEIKEFSKKMSFRTDIVEKDYVLGWLLAGISAQKNLFHNLIFKGGTCLKKCHLETYRLSEDLDYTVLDKKYLDENFLISSFKTVSDWVYENSNIEMPKDLISFKKYQNKKGVISVRGKIGFRGPLLKKKNLSKIQLDLTASEILVLKPVKLKVHHPYSDEPKRGITAYVILMKKLLQRKSGLWLKEQDPGTCMILYAFSEINLFYQTISFYFRY